MDETQVGCWNFGLGAEFWKPEYLEPLKIDCNWHLIGDLLTNVQYGISREMNEDAIGEPIYRMNEMDGLFLSVPEKHVVLERDEYSTFSLSVGDVLFNRTNSFKYVGRTGILKEPINAVFASYLIRLVPDTTKILPEYLAVYLNSPTGIGQVKRRAMESINQANVSGSEIRKVPIPRLPLSFQQTIAKIVDTAAEITIAARETYSSAEHFLLSELGMDDLDLSPTLFYERNFSESQEVTRLDAEYWMPIKWKILERLHALPGVPMATLFKTVRSLISPDKERPDILFRNYDLTNALAPFLDDSAVPTEAQYIGSTKKRLRHGDVVISRLRSYLKEVALVCSVDGPQQIGSSEFIVLRCIDKKVLPEVLLVYLRCPWVQTILKWCQDGSNHPRFNEREIMTLPFPDVLLECQEDIASLIQDSRKARDESRRLLEDAKRMVEEAITGSAQETN